MAFFNWSSVRPLADGVTGVLVKAGVGGTGVTVAAGGGTGVSVAAGGSMVSVAGTMTVGTSVGVADCRVQAEMANIRTSRGRKSLRFNLISL